MCYASEKKFNYRKCIYVFYLNTKWGAWFYVSNFIFLRLLYQFVKYKKIISSNQHNMFKVLSIWSVYFLSYSEYSNEKNFHIDERTSCFIFMALACSHKKVWVIEIFSLLSLPMFTNFLTRLRMQVFYRN